MSYDYFGISIIFFSFPYLKFFPLFATEYI
jgi:hypothetical protein